MPREVGRLARDPVFERIERQMDDLVERLLSRPSTAAYQRAWAPRVDVYETDDEFVAVVELAGTEPEAVTIEIEGEEVAITGSRDPRKAPEGGECLQLEIPFGVFERRLVLPAAVDAARASADFSDGVLTVRLPKTKQGPTRVQVAVQWPE